MKILSCVAFIFFYLLISLCTEAQKNNSNEFTYPEFNIRTIPSSFADFDAGIMLGVNYRWSNRFSASFEPTWIFYATYSPDDGERSNPSGFRIRSDFRLHFGERRKRVPDFFIATEIHLKYVSTQKEGEFGINCQGGQCAYFQTAVYTEIKKEIGGLIKTGLIIPLSFIDKKDHFLFEIYGGLGVKRLKFAEKDLPVGGSFLNPPIRDFLDFGNNSDRNLVWRPLLPAGIKFAWVL